MERSLIEPTSRTNCSQEVHQPQHNHGRMDLINHDKVIGNIMGGDIPKTCGTHQSTTIGGGYLTSKDAFTRDRWTQLTTGQHHDAHHIYSKQFVSLIFDCESLIFQHEQTCRRPFLAASASAKQKPVHCTAMIRGMNYHAIPAPDYEGGGPSKREELCQQDPKQFTIPATGA